MAYVQRRRSSQYLLSKKLAPNLIPRGHPHSAAHLPIWLGGKPWQVGQESEPGPPLMPRCSTPHPRIAQTLRSRRAYVNRLREMSRFSGNGHWSVADHGHGGSADAYTAQVGAYPEVDHGCVWMSMICTVAGCSALLRCVRSIAGALICRISGATNTEGKMLHIARVQKHVVL